MTASATAMSGPDTEHALEQILKCKWTMTILAAIAEGTERPSAMLRTVPNLSHKVLNQRLAKLTRLQVVSREVISERPLHVIYRLSPFGADIRNILAVVAETQRIWDERASAP